MSNELLVSELGKIGECISKGLILWDKVDEESERSCMVISEKELNRSIRDLKSSFPSNAIHCYASKANYTPIVLEIAKKNGLSVECCSYEEILYAKNTCFDVDDVVFDSPAKTVFEIEQSLKMNIFLLNVDNLVELERVKEARLKYPKTKTIIGLRINPQIDKLKKVCSAYATGTKYAKFGIPLKELGYEKLFDEIKELEYIKALHIHGGEGPDDAEGHLKVLVQGIEYVYKFAEYVNSRLGRQQIKYIDIGGGFPTFTSMDVGQLSYAVYWDMMKDFFDKEKYTLITEFGMSTIHRAGFILSRIEYVKFSGGHQILIIQSGCNTFPCIAYSKCKIMQIYEKFFNKDGSEKKIEYYEGNEGDDENYPTQMDICGPLCFSGDMLTPLKGKDVRKPIKEIRENDVIVFPGAGGYSISEYCKSNSRRLMSIYLLKEDGSMKCVKKIESFKSCLDFWRV